MSVRVTHTLDRLARDVKKAPETESRKMTRAVTSLGKYGMTVAKNDARRKSGKAGVHYPDSFTQDSDFFNVFGAGNWSTVYGPDASKDQGNMNFEHGPGPQTTPHLSVAISHDAVKTRLGKIGDVYNGGVYQ